MYLFLRKYFDLWIILILIELSFISLLKIIKYFSYLILMFIKIKEDEFFLNSGINFYNWGEYDIDEE